MAFDFNALFNNEEEEQDFMPCYRASHLLSQKSYISNKEFSIKRLSSCDKSITFIDTLNFARLSVEKLGKIVGVPKLDKPSFLGQKPKNKEEEEILKVYNFRDSEISKKFLEFFI